ncbi:hypothetical protein B566_EDAN010853 [Ephemera danica]|nr:hypothetical protein B566_EDAN010853 [Ephemera danica]
MEQFIPGIRYLSLFICGITSNFHFCPQVSRSGARAVVLSDVQRELTSFYKCEVSADAPLFHTDVKSALMLVVDVPQDVPSITIGKYRYSLDEPIAANCTSPGSFPAANLTWIVNGMPQKAQVTDDDCEKAGIERVVIDVCLNPKKTKMA